uniref:Uncharacterized protein n=1 Tax=Arundo donax TaxID=35708 RepID=A0A0A9G014_ARUDO
MFCHVQIWLTILSEDFLS